tara:strand:+ start:3834 stop:4454 length:621 start_codon:yes stop_codon:yes gene_type:complete
MSDEKKLPETFGELIKHNEPALSFEELTGASSQEEWNETTLDSEYAKISAKAEALQKLQENVKTLEEALKETKEKLRIVEEQELPEAMQAANLLEIKLINGTKIAVSQFFKGSISEKNREKAHQWLLDNHHGGIIKHEVNLKFGKDEGEKAKDAVQSLKQKGLDPAVKESVHPQTLNAFVKEQMTGGKDLPADLFGVYVGSRAKLK